MDGFRYADPMPHSRAASLIAAALVALSSCGVGKLGGRLGKEARPGDSVGSSPTLVRGGTIRLVRDSLGFVLIQSTGSPTEAQRVDATVAGVGR